MKDYLVKRDPNLEALIARYKEPKPIVEPRPIVQPKLTAEERRRASVTFVDAGDKPMPKAIVQDEPRVAVSEEPSRISSTVVCILWFWSMATGAAYLAHGPSVIGPMISGLICLWIFIAFVASCNEHGG